LSIAEEENIVCVILTSKPEVADYLLSLKGEKIQPFPGFAREVWKPSSDDETGRQDIRWTARQLRALFAVEFG
jgi:hypothetical protein